jgi:hypothetical protein
MTAYGQKSNVGIIFQTSYGTAGSVNSVQYIGCLSESMALNIPPIISENMRGIFDEGDTYVGAKTVSGDIEAEAGAIELGVMLNCILQETSTVQSGGIYSHNFKPRASDWDDYSANRPVSVYRRLDMGAYERFYDCTGTSLEMSIAQGELLKAKVSLVGGQLSTTSGAPSATYSTNRRFTWDVASFSLGGTGNSTLVNATIKVDDALEAQHTLSTANAPTRIKRTGMRTVGVDLTVKFDDYSEYLEFQNQTERNMTVSFKGPTEIQSGYFEKLTVILPAMRYEEFKPNFSGAGQIEVSAKAKAKYYVTSANTMLVTLVNTQASY